MHSLYKHTLNHHVHSPCMALSGYDPGPISSIRSMDSFITHAEYWGPWASDTSVKALGAQGDVVVPWTGVTLGVCGAVTAAFHHTTLAGIPGTMLITRVTVYGAAGAADGGVVGIMQRVPGLARHTQVCDWHQCSTS